MEGNILVVEKVLEGSFEPTFKNNFYRKYYHLFDMDTETRMVVMEEAKRIYVHGSVVDRASRELELMNQKPGLVNFVIDIFDMAKDIGRRCREVQACCSI